MAGTLRNQPAEYDGDRNNNKLYLNITAYLYPLVHVIIGLDGFKKVSYFITLYFLLWLAVHPVGQSHERRPGGQSCEEASGGG